MVLNFPSQNVVLLHFYKMATLARRACSSLRLVRQSSSSSSSTAAAAATTSSIADSSTSISALPSTVTHTGQVQIYSELNEYPSQPPLPQYFVHEGSISNILSDNISPPGMGR